MGKQSEAVVTASAGEAPRVDDASAPQPMKTGRQTRHPTETAAALALARALGVALATGAARFRVVADHQGAGAGFGHLACTHVAYVREGHS